MEELNNTNSFVDACKNFVKKEVRSKFNGRDVPLYIGVDWLIGGLSGGSCWDSGEEPHRYALDADSEPDFEIFEAILEHFTPNITYLQYKKILRTLLKEREYSDNDYYGNYSNYRQKYIELEDLYEFLSTHRSSM